MANSLREVSEKETIKITEFRIVLNHIKKDNSKEPHANSTIIN